MKSNNSSPHKEPPVLPVVLLFGPTGVGKTELIKNLPGSDFEIISADSMQVYRGMDIGTAKPDRALCEHIPHHLIDIRNPDEQFHLGDFIRLADEAVLEILKRGRMPVLSGGTAYYFKHFLYGLPEAPPSNPKIRAQLVKKEREEGIDSLREILNRVDSVSAERIDDNDAYRIKRALEVFMTCGRPLSAFKVPQNLRTGLDPLIIGIKRPREELYRRIDARVEQMIDAGLRREVECLKKNGYGPETPGMKAIGYREFSEEDQEIIQRIQTASRRYAKRQLTFFRALPDTLWMPAEKPEEIIRSIYSFFRSRKEMISRIASDSNE